MTGHDRHEPSGAGSGGPPARHTGVTDGNLAHTIELREFMEQLGLVMQLPSRKPGSPRPTPSRAAPRSAPWVPVALLALAAVAGYFVFKPAAENDTLPAIALGQWATTDARYANRGFAVDSASVVFVTGPGATDFTAHAILGTKVRSDHGKQIVTVDYAIPDGSMRVAFWVEPGPAPVLHFMNQPSIAWRRVPPSVAP